MSVELPLFTTTLLISHSSYLTVMTMGSSLWGWMQNSLSSKKTVASSGTFISLTYGRSSMFRTWHNRLAIVLIMWHTDAQPSSLGASLALLIPRLSKYFRPRRLRHFSWMESPFTYFLSFPLCISFSISFFNW